jgi:hypothetical protein
MARKSKAPAELTQQAHLAMIADKDRAWLWEWTRQMLASPAGFHMLAILGIEMGKRTRLEDELILKPADPDGLVPPRP